MDPRVDLRSDTSTLPTPEMRRAMAEAVVGNDVYGEDPTVNELETLACRMTGKEAAVFVASGTMGNVAAILAHTHRGDEVICGYRSHIFREEQGAMAALAGVQPYVVPENDDGALPLQAIEAAIRTDDQHYPITRLICLENTHNLCGGSPLSVEHTQAVAELARRYGLLLHIDGARLFNAAVALNVSAEALVAPAQSVTFCLSKGLGAPVGSVLCGEALFIERARRARKLLGGGMRQAGILAAAGIVALTTMVERLQTDHANARRLARGLAAIEGLRVDPDAVRTNMVYFDLAETVPCTGGELDAGLQARAVLLDPIGPRTFRAVTHCDIDAEQVDRAVEAIRALLVDGSANRADA